MYLQVLILNLVLEVHGWVALLRYYEVYTHTFVGWLNRRSSITRDTTGDPESLCSTLRLGLGPLCFYFCVIMLLSIMLSEFEILEHDYATYMLA